MSPLPHRCLCKSRPEQGGFALVIALSLMAFVVLLLLSITTLVRVETRSSMTQMATLEAKQNALLGMQIALGELQAAAGPDQRSVARAGLMHKHAKLGGPASELPEAVTTPKDTRTLWTGVSHSDGFSDVAVNKPVVWLVSGLDRSQTSAAQLGGDLTDPINMITIPQTPTPGAPPAATVRAGKVPIDGRDSSLSGKFAWVIDDETQKAKLAPAVDAVRNDTPSERLDRQRSVLPGFFSLGPTTGLSTADADYFRASNIQDLLIGAPDDAEIINERFFDYTLYGHGVLADTRNGGLKRDLTAAYESNNIFNDLFPNQSAPYNPSQETSYLAIDRDRLANAGASDLLTNGYIHHGIFRDYYRLKDRVNNNTLPISVVDKRLFDNDATQQTRQGTLGPHQINNLQHPYGKFTIWSGSSIASVAGAHNPITPVLAFMQQNAWIERVDARSELDPRFTNFTELWTGIYNPYNVSLEVETDGKGPMFRGYPMPRIFLFNGDDRTFATHQNVRGDNWAGFLLREERWIWTRETVRIDPGRTQIFGFGDSVDVGQTSGARRHTFSKNIGEAVNSASNRERRLTSDAGSTFPVDMLVEMSFLSGSGANHWNGPSMAWGLPAQPNSRNPQSHAGHEIAQVFYLPFTKDFITNRTDSIEGQSVDKSRRPRRSRYLDSPGVQFYRQDVPWVGGRMSSADEAVYEFKLRTTTERTNQGQLRPLVDSNIRAIWNNPKWDTDLGLNAIATHSFITNKSDDPDASSISPDNLAQPQGNEAFLSYGNSLDDQGSQQVILFDVPREPLVSLGQLQHAAAGRFSYEPTYVVGNSYANIRLPLNNWFRTDATDTYSGQHNNLFAIPGSFSLYDASYLVNEALFDSYTFSTIPQDSSQNELDSYLNRTQLLQNPRYLPYEPLGSTFNAENLQADESGRTNAGFLLVDGAFNVNSTSVEAWEVFLSGTKGLPFRKMDASGAVTGFEDIDGVHFPRVQTIMGEPWENAPDGDAWFGFRELTTTEIRELAEAIVEQIRERGPFHNLSDFINRQLATNEAGRAGVLQAALDAAINSTIPTTSSFEFDTDRGRFGQIAEGSTQGAGFPTQLLQGDLLQALAPYMQTRSDTFKIRTYGESVSPITGETVSRVRGEAVVQRLPDPVADASSGDALNELANPSSTFGRQFQIVAFRWLTDDEI